MSEELPVALPKNLFRNSIDLPETALALLDDPGIIDSMISSSELPRDTESCHALLQTQTATIASHVATIASQNQKLEDLTIEMEKLRKLVTRLLKGNHSERQILPAENQSLLPFESSEEFQAARAEAEAEAEAIVQTYTVTRTVNNKKKRDESLPSHLPRVEKIIEGTAAQMNCPEHGKRQPIGFDTTETLVYKPAELYVEVRKYFKYACLSHPECGVASPERPTSLVEGDRYGTSVATAVVVAEKVAESRAKGDSSLLAKMWAYMGLYQAPYNIFDFRVSRHRDGPDDFFRDSRCIVQGDCFSGNLSVVMQSDERLTFAACWSHARRKVVEATTYRKECELLLGMIQALYDIEVRGKSLSWQDRQALRERESKVVLEAMWRWLDSRPLQDVLPKSDFADALRYIRNHWKELNVYVRDGRIPIDNNSVEQLMKQVAMGRKAWLFVCSVAGGEQSARMMTLVSSARRHDLDVGLYLKDVLDQLLAGCTDYDRLLPDVWKQSHPEAVREYRVEERRDKAERKQLAAARRRIAARQEG
jgi:transposase